MTNSGCMTAGQVMRSLPLTGRRETGTVGLPIKEIMCGEVIVDIILCNETIILIADRVPSSQLVQSGVRACVKI